MDIYNLIEKPGAANTKEAAGGHGTQTANLVEMGSVLNETKGFLRGLELGFTPRSG
jgi:hypothetical protein